MVRLWREPSTPRELSIFRTHNAPPFPPNLGLPSPRPYSLHPSRPSSAVYKADTSTPPQPWHPRRIPPCPSTLKLRYSTYLRSTGSHLLPVCVAERRYLRIESVCSSTGRASESAR